MADERRTALHSTRGDAAVDRTEVLRVKVVG